MEVISEKPREMGKLQRNDICVTCVTGIPNRSISVANLCAKWSWQKVRKGGEEE